MRFLPTALLLPLFFFLANASGCKEGCDDVVCAPTPPLLTMIVRDTLSQLQTIRGIDTLTGDSIDLRDTVVIVVEPTVDVVLTLHTFASGTVGSVIDTVRTTSDTMFIYDDRSRQYSGEFALVAARGGRADTLDRLSLKTVEGCCGYDVIGNYSMRLPEK